MADYKTLKARLTIEQVAGMLGLKMKPESNQLRSACPACNRGGDRALVVTPSKGAFYCQAAKTGGSLLDLAAHIRDETVPAAAEFLESQLGIVTETVTGNSHGNGNSSTNAPAPKAFTGFDRAKYQQGLDRSHELLKDIPPDFIERADIGVSNRGALKGIVLPTYDKDTGDFLCYVRVEGLTLPKATVTPLKKAG